MVVNVVNVFVKKNYIDDFINITLENHKGSVKEPGNLRFDVLQSIQDPCYFVLYEAYESEEASVAHKSTPHYLKWKETVVEWMEKPRKGISYKVIAPLEKSQW